MDGSGLIERMKRGEKCIIGMVHCLPLPGTLGYGGSMEEIHGRAVRDGMILERAGADAIIVENTNDFPQSEKLETEQVAALAAVTRSVVEKAGIPVGVDAAFSDGAAGIAIACAAGASFIRSPVFVDCVQVTGVGRIYPCARQVIRMKQVLGAYGIKVFADVQVKHSRLLMDEVSLEESCQGAVSAGADALIITGISTGMETSLDAVRAAKAAVEIPVIIGSGFRRDNAREQLKVADGAIVGTALKVGGLTMNPVDLELCSQLMAEVRR